MTEDNYELTPKVQRFSGLIGRFEQALNERKYGQVVLGFVRGDGKRCLVYERGTPLNENMREEERKEFVDDLSSFFPGEICRQSSFILETITSLA